MASIRDQILTALTARLAAISGWTASMRASENTVQAAVVAIVYPLGEDKTLANSDSYQCTFRTEVLIVARVENASATLDGGNAYRYLDRLVTAAEKVVHSPDSWAVNPTFTDVWIAGHEVMDPSEENEIAARLFLTFSYRHDYRNPEA